VSVLLLVSCIGLVGWIGYLILALPTSYRADNWDLAWVGFDLGMLATLLTTSWAIWKSRQVAIPGAMISATFLIIDSWFDVITSNAGIDFKIASFSALLIELPAAVMLFEFSRRAIRQSIHNAHRRAGVETESLSLWKTHLTMFKD
jgi:hypothetical protein